MSNYPEGFPPDGVTRLQGKEYITHTGLVWLATRQGPWSSTVDHVERVFDDQGLPLYIEVHVTVTSGDVSHTAIGDASRANVGKMIATALPRMAHTRALNRALRALLGQGATTAEEIPAGPGAAQNRPSQPKSTGTPPNAQNGPTGPSKGEQVAQAIVDGAANQCPTCASRVWDNRATATGKQPLWKCSNKQCPGGRSGRGWASWEDWPREWSLAQQPDTSGPPPQDGPPPYTDEDIPF